ncbi:hypothetical protein LXL04_001942 [Taraxacum kok-saghyz]
MTSHNNRLVQSAHDCSQRPDGSDPWVSIGGSGENPRPCSYQHFTNCNPIFLRKQGRRQADSINGHVQMIDITAANPMSWDELKTMILEGSCPRSEVQKLEQEFWNLTIKGSEAKAYTTRFTKLAILCSEMVTPVDKKVERYICGNTPRINGSKADPPLGESNKRESWEISHDNDQVSDPKYDRYEENDSGSEEYYDSDLEPEE